MLAGVAHRGAELPGADRALEEIGRLQARDLDRCPESAMRAQHDHRERRAPASQLADELERCCLIGLGRRDETGAFAAEGVREQRRGVVKGDDGIDARRERRLDPVRSSRSGSMT